MFAFSADVCGGGLSASLEAELGEDAADAVLDVLTLRKSRPAI
jgi:hypothetical protein